MKKKTKIFLIIIALLVVVIVGLFAGNKISKFAETKKDAVEFNASTIDSDFANNEISAEKKYIGNRYYVEGTIYSIDDWNGKARITIRYNGGHYNGGHDLYFDAYDNDDTLDFYVGQKIIASGTLAKFDSYWNNATFENSVFTMPKDITE